MGGVRGGAQGGDPQLQAALPDVRRHGMACHAVTWQLCCPRVVLRAMQAGAAALSACGLGKPRCSRAPLWGQASCWEWESPWNSIYPPGSHQCRCLPPAFCYFLSLRRFMCVLTLDVMQQLHSGMASKLQQQGRHNQGPDL